MIKHVMTPDRYVGYPMAKNLRAKIAAEDTLLVHDRDEKAVAQFVKEIGIAAAGTGRSDKGMGIEVISSPREVAERSVSSQPCYTDL